MEPKPETNHVALFTDQPMQQSDDSLRIMVAVPDMSFCRAMAKIARRLLNDLTDTGADTDPLR